MMSIKLGYGNLLSWGDEDDEDKEESLFLGVYSVQDIVSVF